MGFCEAQLRRLEPLWSRMLRHPFLLETRDGTLEEGLDGLGADAGPAAAPSAVGEEA